MDILFVTSRHPPFDTRIYHKMFLSIKNAGFDIKILLPNQVFLSQKNEYFISFKGFSGHWLNLINNFLIVLRCLTIKPNIIFFFDPDLLPFFVVYKLLSNTSIVYDNHEDYPSYIMIKDSIPVWARKLVRLLFLIFFKLGKSIFEFITYADPFTTGIDLSNPKEVVIYNFPIIEHFPDQKKEYDLIYPGSIDLGVCERLLKIAEKLDESTERIIVFMIIGRDVTPSNRELIERYQRDHFHTKIILKHNLLYDEVQEYISRSRIGLNPLPFVEKFRKNIPIKLFEYLMHSIPILASDLRPISMFLNKTKGNFCIKEDNYSYYYSENIIRILNDYSIYSELAKQNYKILEENWNWNKSEETKLIHITNSLISK